MSDTAGPQQDDIALLNHPGTGSHGQLFRGKKCVAHALEAAQQWMLLLCTSPAAWCLGRDTWDVFCSSPGDPRGFVMVRPAVNSAEHIPPWCACALIIFLICDSPFVT